MVHRRPPPDRARWPALLLVAGCGGIGLADPAETHWRGAPLSAGEIGIVALPVEGIGEIAVRIALPVRPRYAEGAPVVVIVPTFFTPGRGFTTDPEATQLGMVTLTLLWPGISDPETGAHRGGGEDFGGPDSTRALAAVVRYAAGGLVDAEGAHLDQRATMTVLTDEVGLFAFSHPGIAATNLMAEYGASLRGMLDWYVGSENPTDDALCAVEAGHFGPDRAAVTNEAYQGLGPKGLQIDYGHVGWEQSAAHPSGVPVIGVGTAHPYVLGDKVPRFYGKRTWSTALTAALRDQGALSESAWPADVSTPEEAAAIWATRRPVDRYPAIAGQLPDLHLMLLFGARGHVQPLHDIPEIHQAWLGFHEIAGLWVRLNPDAAYMSVMQSGPVGLEHPANTAPTDWSEGVRWGWPHPGGAARRWATFAGLAEMADRQHAHDWSADLDQVLFDGPIPAPPARPPRGADKPRKRP